MRTMAQVRQALSSLSGFPEWLPAGHIVEQHFVDILRRTFEIGRASCRERVCLYV